MYEYITLTRIYKNSGLFNSEVVFVLKFLNSESIFDEKEFHSFDEGVVYLGNKGYKLCSILPSSPGCHVEKGWFSKKVS